MDSDLDRPDYSLDSYESYLDRPEHSRTDVDRPAHNQSDIDFYE